MNRSLIETTLQSVFATIVTPNPVIFDSQNAPAPAKPYFTMFLIDSRQVKEVSEQLPLSVLGSVAYIDDIELSVNIRGYGDGVLAKIDLIRSAFNKPSVRQLLAAGGLVYLNCGNIIDTTSIQQVDFVEAASLDIRFRTTETQADVVGTIGSVEIEGTIKNMVGSDKVITFDI